MSAKAEIAWKTREADGTRRQVYARRVGGEWIFYERMRRFDSWQRIESPSLGDWLQLLDAIKRRVQRKLLPPEVETRAKSRIRELFPSFSLDR